MNFDIAPKMSWLCCLLLASLSFGQLQAQSADSETEKLELKATARSFGDSIVVRWIPTNYPTWQLGNLLLQFRMR